MVLITHGELDGRHRERKEYAEDSAQAGARRHAEDIGRNQGVAEQGLVTGAGRGQGAADQQGREHPGQPDGQEDLALGSGFPAPRKAGHQDRQGVTNAQRIRTNQERDAGQQHDRAGQHQRDAGSPPGAV